MEVSYDNIDQERLLDEVNRRVADGKILSLLRSFLKAGVMEEMKVVDSEKGTPQGGIAAAGQHLPACHGRTTGV